MLLRSLIFLSLFILFSCSNVKKNVDQGIRLEGTTLAKDQNKDDTSIDWKMKLSELTTATMIKTEVKDDKGNNLTDGICCYVNMSNGVTKKWKKFFPKDVMDLTDDIGLLGLNLTSLICKKSGFSQVSVSYGNPIKHCDKYDANAYGKYDDRKCQVSRYQVVDCGQTMAIERRNRNCFKGDYLHHNNEKG